MHVVQCDGEACRLVLDHINDVRFVQNNGGFSQIGSYRGERL